MIAKTTLIFLMVVKNLKMKIDDIDPEKSKDRKTKLGINCKKK